MSVSYSNRIRDKCFINPELACNLVAACDPVLYSPVLDSCAVLHLPCQNETFQKRRRYTDVPQQTRSICLTSNDRRHSYQDRLVGPVLLYGNFDETKMPCPAIQVLAQQSKSYLRSVVLPRTNQEPVSAFANN